MTSVETLEAFLDHETQIMPFATGRVLAAAKSCVRCQLSFRGDEERNDGDGAIEPSPDVQAIRKRRHRGRIVAGSQVDEERVPRLEIECLDQRCA